MKSAEYCMSPSPTVVCVYYCRTYEKAVSGGGGEVLESESRLVSHGQSRPCPWGSHYKFYNGPDRTLGSRPTHIRLYAPADRRRIDMRPNPI